MLCDQSVYVLGLLAYICHVLLGRGSGKSYQPEINEMSEVMKLLKVWIEESCRQEVKCQEEWKLFEEM